MSTEKIADNSAEGIFPAGTIVHLGGIPFRLTEPAKVEGSMGNFILAEDFVGVVRHYSSADVSGA